MTPGQAIRTYCVHCCGGQNARVAGCDGDETASGKVSYRVGFIPTGLERVVRPSG